jgi:hypothetical protein
MEPVIKLITIIPEGTDFKEQVAAEQVGSNLYCILETPLFADHINYGDFVRIEEQTTGELIVMNIHSNSNYITHKLLLPIDLINRDAITDFTKPVVDAGGTWETAMGGLLFIHLPKDSLFDIESLSPKNQSKD